MSAVVVFDLETVPDLAAVARVHGIDPADEALAREKLGTGFPKLPVHKIVSIGALVAEPDAEGWRVHALGAPHVGQRDEGALIAGFAAMLARLRPQLVGFNTHSFDLPVLRYRSLITGVSAAGLFARPYFKRYDEAALDLCDVLGSYDARAKMSLDSLCRVLDLTGKPEGMDGSRVAEFVADGRLDDVAAYCRADIVATYRLWLGYERMRGALTQDGYAASMADLQRWIERTSGAVAGPTTSGIAA